MLISDYAPERATVSRSLCCLTLAAWIAISKPVSVLCGTATQTNLKTPAFFSHNRFSNDYVCDRIMPDARLVRCQRMELPEQVHASDHQSIFAGTRHMSPCMSYCQRGVECMNDEPGKFG